MKNLEVFAVVPKDLPSVNYWDKRHKLPELSGIYFVIRHDEAIAYVGQALSLKSRWSGAHGVKLKISKHAGKHRIHYLECDASSLDKYEAYFIHKYRPPLNITYPRIGAHELIKIVESGALRRCQVLEEVCQIYQESSKSLTESFDAVSRLLSKSSDHTELLLKTFGDLSKSQDKIEELEVRIRELEGAMILGLEAKVQELESLIPRSWSANSRN